ncbi:MAG TPA: hypothetical protein VKK79_02465, partial [Candidatus Lokiarchaeia archaeon]|nr:hypothetical protein [Candidatus Lokiarchaeia archaeon]
NARVIKAEVLADLVSISPAWREALAEARANSERGDIAAQRALAQRLGLAKENDTERYYADQGKEVPEFDQVHENANQVPNRVITDYLPKNLDRTSETPAQPPESNSGEN